MNQAALKKKIFAEICQIKNFPEITPTYVSVGAIPFRPNSRRFYSYPKLFGLLVDYLAPVVVKIKPDRLAGGATAGIPLATALSLKTGIPMIYVRKEAKTKGGVSHGMIEGDYQRGERVILIEDILSDGKTKVLFVKNLHQADLKVINILTITQTHNRLDPVFKRLIKQKKISLYCFATLEELTLAQIKAKAIPSLLAPLLLDYVRRPESWQNNPKKWRPYCRALKKLKIRIPDFLKKYE